jgi:hypothetical protein
MDGFFYGNIRDLEYFFAFGVVNVYGVTNVGFNVFTFHTNRGT